MSISANNRKPGRPVKEADARKRHRVQVAMTDQEVQTAKELAKMNGTSVSGAVVEAVKARLRLQSEGLESELQQLREQNQVLVVQNLNLRSAVLMTRLLCRTLLVEDEHTRQKAGCPMLDSELRMSIELAFKETSALTG
ncbi:MAG: hypothetical protein FGM33_06215 [Candidatus Kapabacteria bacterium]|nr:hypothetical protein [Candidatus Kapabacteria bacterium]